MEFGVENIEIKKIPIEKAMEQLRNGGIEVNRKEAELIMEFLYNLTRIVIKKHFPPQ